MSEVYRSDERLISHLLLPASTLKQHATDDADLPRGASGKPGTGTGTTI